MSSVIQMKELPACDKKSIEQTKPECLQQQQQDAKKSLIGRMMIRGECASALGFTALSTMILGLGLLTFIGYIIYVYGFNAGDWNPSCNNCNG